MFYLSNELIDETTQFAGHFVAYFNAHMLLGVFAGLLCGSAAMIRLHAR